jgi:hypothetical protein
VEYYRALPDLQRPSLDTPEAVRQTIDVILLEPYYERTAREMGLDKDPMAISPDRAASRGADGRAPVPGLDHVEESSFRPRTGGSTTRTSQHHFVTAPNAEFAVFGSATRKGADSVVARLQGGESASQILAPTRWREEARHDPARAAGRAGQGVPQAGVRGAQAG